MMAQYRRIKGELPKDALLLFRLGDFYEMFFEDAQHGAQLLNVALTQRNGVPMCGIPHHAADGYMAKLLKAGRKVAICEQVEDAKPGKLVQREVTQILSPGTHFDERMLPAERNNYLAAVCSANQSFGLAVVDLTTGGFRVTQLDSDGALLTELDRLRPAEVIHPDTDTGLRDSLRGGLATCNAFEGWNFAPETAVFVVQKHFNVASLDGFGLKDRAAAIGAAGAVLNYLKEHLRRDAANLTSLHFYQRTDYLVLDSTTLRHLEILEPLQEGTPRTATLFAALNRTVTPMGARRLRDWVSQPLAAVEPIVHRQNAVAVWMANPAGLESFRQHLGAVRDLERTINRLTTGNGNARDLVALRIALERIPSLKTLVTDVAQSSGRSARASADLVEPQRSPDEMPELLSRLTAQLIDLPGVVDLIGQAIVSEPPLTVREGGIIQDGFDASLDELRAAQRGGKEWIAQLQQRESERTGIPTLKVRFNSVFGYYIEVTKSHLDKVPAEYTRKQTIANGERYITPELKAMEGKILGAEERAAKLEYELFQRVRESVLARLRDIQSTASALAQLDVLSAFAETARLQDYCRPHVGDSGILHISEGRHPVLEQSMLDERFVPNDVALSSVDRSAEPTREAARDARRSEYCQIALITGPNMAGKSTYIRKVALLTLMAHTGSFIPAAEARIDLVDRIFTRIGASDDLARGQSTFMVEMTETANILNNATTNSLIVLDEIGRGTSTFDGLSLAWSIVEHLHNQVGAKTLFATHYHELTELAARLHRVRNFNVAVREWNDQIVFLRKIIEGGTDKSYGIQVARLAGVPHQVIDRAKVILANLEESELTPEGNVRRKTRQEQDREKLKTIESPPQMDLFG